MQANNLIEEASYYCIFGKTYLTIPEIEDSRVECPVPSISISASSILVLIKEIRAGNTAFSNALTIPLMEKPLLYSISPPVLPAYDKGSITLTISGSNFVVGSTFVFFG